MIARFESLSRLDLGDFNTVGVTDMWGMFCRAGLLLPENRRE